MPKLAERDQSLCTFCGVGGCWCCTVMANGYYGRLGNETRGGCCYAEEYATESG